MSIPRTSPALDTILAQAISNQFHGVVLLTSEIAEELRLFVKDAQRELADYERSFSLYHKASMALLDAYKKAHPEVPDGVWTDASKVSAWAAQELERLRSGKFTAEEIHNFCHNLHGTVSAEQFADGCAAEQIRLYGRAPDRDARLCVNCGKLLIGTWPSNDLRRAFVEGAQWWEFKSKGATMWPSDRDVAEQEAETRYAKPARTDSNL